MKIRVDGETLVSFYIDVDDKFEAIRSHDLNRQKRDELEKELEMAVREQVSIAEVPANAEIDYDVGILNLHGIVFPDESWGIEF